MIQGTITYGDRKISYDVTYSDRASLTISVRPDCSVIVKSPVNVKPGKIEQRVQNRARWILKQQEYFGQFLPKTPPRQYISGETHLYLGRQYRLKITKAETRNVNFKLRESYIRVQTPEPDNRGLTQQLLTNWYRERAEIKFPERLAIVGDRFKRYGFSCPVLQIRSLKKRWGSLTAQGRIILNQDLVRASTSCIDYVITHELCHLKHPNHSQEFYDFLNLVMPDWKSRKQRLERILSLDTHHD